MRLLSPRPPADIPAPDRGQGLNHALEDAGRIVKLLVRPATTSQSELIDEYETEMRTRAGEEVRLSETNSHMMVSTFPIAPFRVDPERGTPIKHTHTHREREREKERERETNATPPA